MIPKGLHGGELVVSSTKVLVISDIHSNYPAYQAVWSKAREVLGKINYSICLGDIIGYGPHPNEVLRSIIQDCDIIVAGNHEHAAITGNYEGLNKHAVAAIKWTNEVLDNKSKQILEIINKYHFARFHVADLEIFACHGSPKNLLMDYVFPKDSKERKDELLDLIYGQGANVLMVGHTHVPMIYQRNDEAGGTILNPGSVGQPRDGIPKASAMTIIIEPDGEIQIDWLRVAYPTIEVARDIREAGLPEWLAERVLFGL